MRRLAVETIGVMGVLLKPPKQEAGAFFEAFELFDNMAVGQNPGTPVNIPKAFKIDYLGRVIIPKKVP